jgi:hypothetical protein
MERLRNPGGGAAARTPRFDFAIANLAARLHLCGSTMEFA